MLLWSERQRKTRRLHFWRITINQIGFSRLQGSPEKVT